MPSAAPSKFKSSGGILRNSDGVITSLLITTENPLYTEEGASKKKSDFKTLWAVLGVREDGKETSSPQPIFIGNADDFGVTEDGMGVTGKAEFSKNSGWFIFLNSLVNPANGDGFDESAFPDEQDAQGDPVARYNAIVGARCRFNWQVNEYQTKKRGMKKSKTIDPKTGKPKEYPYEDLIVTGYYGQVEVEAEEAPAPAKKVGVGSKQPASQAKPLGAKKGGAVDVAKVAAENIVLALSAAKGNTLSKSKVSVKLLTLLGTADAQVRQDVRTWADSNDNLASIEGVDYDSKTEMLSLEKDGE